MIRVLVADDHAIVRQGIKQILADQADIRVVAEADNGAEVLRALRSDGGEIDLVLLDMSMPGRSGIELIKDVKRERPQVRVLVLSMHDEEQYAVRAIKAGAQGYVAKSGAPDDLVAAIRQVARGHVHIRQAVVERLALSFGAPPEEIRPHARLSDREYQVFMMLAQGKTVTAIAEALCLSSKTVSTHKARILQKMGCVSLADLIHYAVREGLVEH